MSGLDPDMGSLPPSHNSLEQPNGGAQGTSPSQEASPKRGLMHDLSGGSNTSNLTGPELSSGMCFCCIWQDPGAVMRKPGRGREVICSLRNVKTARTSCRGLPGHSQLLLWVRVTFFQTRNDICRTGAEGRGESLGHQPHVGAPEEGAGQV